MMGLEKLFFSNIDTDKLPIILEIIPHSCSYKHFFLNLLIYKNKTHVKRKRTKKERSSGDGKRDSNIDECD